MLLSIRESFRSRPILVLLAGAWVLGLSPAASAGDGPEADPRGFADRWVACTGGGDTGLAGLFRKDAVLSWVSLNRTCTVDPEEYETLLRETRKKFKGFTRERGEVEWSCDDPATGSRLSFPVVDRIEMPDGFVIRSEGIEEFAFPPGDPSRAIHYTSRTRAFETEKAPEDWVKYAGPVGLNAHVAQTLFFRPPEGIGLWIAGGLVAVGALLKALHSLGIKRRF